MGPCCRYVCFSSDSGPSSFDVRFCADFVRFTSRSRPSWWCRRRSVPDPKRNGTQLDQSRHRWNPDKPVRGNQPPGRIALSVPASTLGRGHINRRRKAMPKNKRPNRKPGGRKTRKRAAADKTRSGRAVASGGVPNVKGAKSVAITYGSRKSSRSPISPVRNRRSARNK